MPTTLYLKKLTRCWLWFASTFLVLAVLCRAAWPQPHTAVFSDVAEQLARYFPQVTGEVVNVDDGDIYIGVGARDDILPGTQLTLFRPLPNAADTDTGPSVNRVEEAIGYVVVEEVFEHYASARLLAIPGTEARRGDKVRINSGPIVLGVLPIVDKTLQAPHPWDLTTALQSALQVNERFQVVTASRILLWSLENNAPLEDGLSPNLLRQLADSLRFSYVAVGAVEEVGGEAVLDVALLSPLLQRFVASGSAFLTTP
ncbi:MAG: hypothetical protein OXP66_14580 [Candidatus Tectomicrobia bacterium]|nr:hypothetical protein [Candidatus Tectomicrobia bacterium]